MYLPLPKKICINELIDSITGINRGNMTTIEQTKVHHLLC
jgi:hypothetical protein